MQIVSRSLPARALLSPRRIGAMALAGLLALAPAAPASAQGRSLPVVRDAEVEALLRDYATPIFRAAGINAQSTQIVLIADRSFNAFVANGQRIFMNVGAIMDSETPNEVIGVIAHEAGHIAGGHLARLRQEIATAQILSVVGMLAGAGALVGASRSGDTIGNTGTGVSGIFAGGQELAMRNLLSYQRSEEQAADVAAVRYLTATRQSPMGKIRVFERFADSGLFRTRALDPYLLSHPLPAERIALLQRLAAESPYRDAKDPPALQARHDLARAKLFGFVERPETVLNRYPPHDNSLASRYARSIVMHRTGRSSEALALIDGLLAAQPNNPYFHELRGQVLLESARPREAVASLRRAVQLAENAMPIRTLYGQALIALGDGASLEEAVRQLNVVTRREPDWPHAFRHLAMAYGRTGQIPLAELATAEYHFAAGDHASARAQATRAMRGFPEGSPSWRRARDIAEFEPPRR